ncbi:MAG: DUF1491 family protein, partial [Paracoccaceae bacterium]
GRVGRRPTRALGFGLGRMTRLVTHLWVSAYLARLAGDGIYAHLMQKGDPTAGAVAVKCAFMDGQASLFTRYYGSSGEECWHALVDRGPEREVDAILGRQRARDPDLWIVEVEDPRGRHGLGAEEPAD